MLDKLISAQARFGFVVRNGRVIKRYLIFSTIISVLTIQGRNSVTNTVSWMTSLARNFSVTFVVCNLGEQ